MCLEIGVSEGEITEDKDTSDVEAVDVPNDVFLEDFLSGCGEEYNPDFNDIGYIQNLLKVTKIVCFIRLNKYNDPPSIGSHLFLYHLASISHMGQGLSCAH